MSKEDTAKSILEAALKLFSERGYSNATTKEIAEQANVNEVTIFRHFNSKKKLFEKVFDNYIFEPNLKEKEVLFNKKPETFLKDLAHSLNGIFIYNLSLIKIELKNDSTSFQEMRLPLDKFSNQVKDIIVEYIKNNKDLNVKNPETFSIVFLSSIWGLFMNINIIQPFEPNPEFENCLDELINSII